MADNEAKRIRTVGVKKYSAYIRDNIEIGEFREYDTELGTRLELEIYDGHKTPIEVRARLGDIDIYSGVMNDKAVRKFIEDRVVPETRVNIKEILEELGFKNYSAYAIFKKALAKCDLDDFWIDFNNEKIKV